MTGLYPGKFIFKKTILPISAGQAVCPLPTTEIIFLWGFFWLDVNRKYNWESITTIIRIFLAPSRSPRSHSVCLSGTKCSKALTCLRSGFSSVSGQSWVSLRSVSGQSQVSLRSVSGQSQVSFRSVSGQSQVSPKSVPGQPQVSPKSVPGQSQVSPRTLISLFLVSLSLLRQWDGA